MRAEWWINFAARAAVTSVVAVALSLSAYEIAAADGVPGSHASHVAPSHNAHEIRVPLDQAVPLRLSGAASGVAIGNPSIAGVSVQNDRMLFVTGRSYGTTNLIVVGADGQMIYSGLVTVVADETNVVMITRGAETERLNCTPLCRPRPDIGDGHDSFEAASTQIAGHASSASSH